MSDEKKKNDLDYRDTVFLPKTDFPMRGGLPKKEPEIIAKWEELGLYDRLREKGQGAEKFILHDGPPYANGNIHMGHAVNKILKDVVVKSQTMLGKDAPYVPGWDCHGLPIEWKIEEKYRKDGKDKDEVDILEFREECRSFAAEWVDIQSEQFQRLGVVGDWENPYRTMTNRAESKIVSEIHKFAQNGGLYKGLRPVLWSVVEKTALAEAEVEYKEHKSVTIWVRFPVVETSNTLLEGADVVIWTTTPWTIPSNRAIAFGAEIDYGVYEVKAAAEDAKVEVGAKLVLATALAEEVLKQAKIEEYETLGTFKGEECNKGKCKHPLAEAHEYYDYNVGVPMLEGDFVTDDAGTGFVHVAGGHGEDDFNLIRATNENRGEGEKIEITDNITDDGKFRPHVGLFAGEEIYTQEGKLGGGNFSVLRELANAGKLLAKGSLKHEYPHSWRSKAPLIFRTTPQWFIGMDRANIENSNTTLREKALQGIEKTNWHPAKGQARITAMIENRPDWCISRQRAWGVPIALFLHKDTGETMGGLSEEECTKIFADIAQAFEEEGADAWYKDGVEERFLGDKADQYQKVDDIVDVWFESGSTHAFVVGDTQTWPCFANEDGKPVEQIDLYLEGSDQHRGWFHSSLLASVGTKGHAPYKNVLTHGFVLDEKGYKMSKSLGNVVDPLKMMEQYGADIIRLWVMLSDYNEDIRIGKDTLKNTSDLYRRLRNTLRFLLGALDGFTKDENIFSNRHCEETDRATRQSMDCFADARNDVTELPELEQYMLHLLSEMDEFVRESIENYEFGKLAKRLHDFCNQELSAFYFDIRKDRLYCDDPNSFERRACRSVMAVIFNGLSSWLAPILAFTAEEAWSHRPEDVFEDVDSVHLRDFPDVPKNWRNADLANKWKDITAVRSDVTAAIEPLRADKTLGSSLEALADITTESDAVLNTPDLEDICIVSSARVHSGKAKVVIHRAEGMKCERCWKVLPEVSAETKLCNRCTDVVSKTKAKAA